MSWLGDVFDFEKFNLGEMFDKAKKDPERLFLGAADPFGSKLWGGILGKDYEPMVNQLGGASDDTYAKAKAQGINTGPGKSMHNIAGAIASFYGGQGLMNMGGGGGGWETSADGFASQEAGLDTAGWGGAGGGGWNTSANGIAAQEYGLSGADKAGWGGAGGGSGGSGSSWADMFNNNMPSFGNQQQQKQYEYDTSLIEKANKEREIAMLIELLKKEA